MYGRFQGCPQLVPMMPRDTPVPRTAPHLQLVVLFGVGQYGPRIAYYRLIEVITKPSRVYLANYRPISTYPPL